MPDDGPQLRAADAGRLPASSYARPFLQGDDELQPHYGDHLRMPGDDRTELRTADVQLPAASAAENHGAELRQPSASAASAGARNAHHGSELPLNMTLTLG